LPVAGFDLRGGLIDAAARGGDLVGAFTSSLVSAVTRWDVDERGLLRGGAAA